MTCQRGTIHVDFSASPRLTVEPQQESGSTPPAPARHFTVDDDVLVASEIQNFVDVVERQFEPIVSPMTRSWPSPHVRRSSSR